MLSGHPVCTWSLGLVLRVLIHLIFQIALWCRGVAVSTEHYKETKAQKGYISVRGLTISIDREACLFDLRTLWTLAHDKPPHLPPLLIHVRRFPSPLSVPRMQGPLTPEVCREKAQTLSPEQTHTMQAACTHNAGRASDDELFEHLPTSQPF